jgi:hypothetical protein
MIKKNTMLALFFLSVVVGAMPGTDTQFQAANSATLSAKRLQRLERRQARLMRIAAAKKRRQARRAALKARRKARIAAFKARKRARLEALRARKRARIEAKLRKKGLWPAAPGVATNPRTFPHFKRMLASMPFDADVHGLDPYTPRNLSEMEHFFEPVINQLKRSLPRTGSTSLTPDQMNAYFDSIRSYPGLASRDINPLVLRAATLCNYFDSGIECTNESNMMYSGLLFLLACEPGSQNWDLDRAQYPAMFNGEEPVLGAAGQCRQPLEGGSDDLSRYFANYTYQHIHPDALASHPQRPGIRIQGNFHNHAAYIFMASLQYMISLCNILEGLQGDILIPRHDPAHPIHIIARDTLVNFTMALKDMRDTHIDQARTGGLCPQGFTNRMLGAFSRSLDSAKNVIQSNPALQSKFGDDFFQEV